MILADSDPMFQPAMRIINDVTNAYPALVTTSFAHQYLDGLIVRLDIPEGFGMYQADQLYGPIIVTGATTFTIDIDTTNFEPFGISIVFPSSYQSAQVVPIGELNGAYLNATRNVLN